MPFITGSANSMAQLQTALFNGLVANGWTLAGNVIYKGDTYIEVTIPTGESQGENRMLRFLGGNSQAGGVLGDVAPVGPRIGAAKNTTWAWPVSYNLHIFTAPDEVYLKIRRDLNHYQFVAFGKSDVKGLPGNDIWVTATHSDRDSTEDILGITSSGNSTDGAGNWRGSQAPFWGGNGLTFGLPYESVVLHSGLDAVGWWQGSGAGGTLGNLNAAQMVSPHLDRSPNAWNGEAPLLPIQPFVLRPSNKLSIVADLAHARFLRIDNYSPEEIIDLSPDYWMVYPFRSKNITERDGGQGLTHTGTFGWAIRYDGP